MRLFSTIYTIKSVRYGSYIVANTQEEAEMLALVRNIGEIVDGQSLRGYYPMDMNIHDLVLEVTFASFIAIESQLYPTVDILGKSGILTRLNHLATVKYTHHIPSNSDIEELEDDIIKLYKLVHLPYNRADIHKVLFTRANGK